MQLIIDTETNRVTAITLTNGLPTYPTKTLDLVNGNLTDKEKEIIQTALSLITSKAL